MLSTVLCLLTMGVYGQTRVSTGQDIQDYSETAISGVDTLFPALASDSCSPGSTFYTLGGKIITGAATLGDGSVISRVGQAFDSGNDSISIGSVFAEIVFARTDSGNGQFIVEIFAEQDLQTALGQSLPVAGNLLTDTSGPSIFNDFYFADPVKVQGKFWVVLNTLDGGDSIYLASSGDDCGMGSAIFNNGPDWFYYRDQFTIGGSDPLDVALKFGVVMERIVGDKESGRQELAGIYPNPAEDEIRILLHDVNQPATIRLRSADGQIVRFIPGYRSGDDLKLEGLERGFYLVEVQQKGSKVLERLVIGL